eukprot:4474839-Pleurochrysis_carterae.AAC.3
MSAAAVTARARFLVPLQVSSSALRITFGSVPSAGLLGLTRLLALELGFSQQGTSVGPLKLKVALKFTRLRGAQDVANCFQ